jgi:hypothetical protein
MDDEHCHELHGYNPQCKISWSNVPKSFYDLKLLVYIITTMVYTNEVQYVT